MAAFQTRNGRVGYLGEGEGAPPARRSVRRPAGDTSGRSSSTSGKISKIHRNPIIPKDIATFGQNSTTFLRPGGVRVGGWGTGHCHGLPRPATSADPKAPTRPPRIRWPNAGNTELLGLLSRPLFLFAQSVCVTLPFAVKAVACCISALGRQDCGSRPDHTLGGRQTGRRGLTTRTEDEGGCH